MKFNFLTRMFLVSLVSGCGVSITSSEKTEPFGDTESTVEETQETGINSDTQDIFDTSEIEDTASPGDSTQITDFFQTGPYEINFQARSASVTNCAAMNYSVYSPDGVDNPTTVVIGHGFARGSGVMTGWAEHLSSWGVEVLLPTLCHYNVFSGVDHEMNGQNMKELAYQHGASQVIYAGHSAGGLAAIIAASQDSSAIGLLGLDTTDTEDIPGVPDGIGQGYVSDISCPSFSLAGEPSSCNADNNGVDLFKSMADYKILKVSSADHCDFENPTDSICELSCENSTAIFGDDEIRSVIITLGTAAVISLAEISEDGSYLWTDAGLQDWTSTGLIQEIE